MAVGYLVYLVGAGNDKSILLMLFYYPVLILVNALIGFGLKIMKVKTGSYFYWAALYLSILFLPVLLISPWLSF